MNIEKIKNMKSMINKTLAIIGLIMIGTGAFAQVPPPPPGGGHGGTGNQEGGGAPIGSGIGILLSMGAAYGARKIYIFRKDKEELES
jgi:hypothetical protein